MDSDNQQQVNTDCETSASKMTVSLDSASSVGGGYEKRYEEPYLEESLFQGMMLGNCHQQHKDKDSQDSSNRHSSMSNESLPLERMAPLGASATDTEDYPDCNESSFSEKSQETLRDSRLQTLEEEQEQLIASLVQLTTHFAQVQFRLQQITEAPVDDEKQVLLKELEEFASRGIPDVRGLLKDTVRHSMLAPDGQEDSVEYQKLKQQELISQLKNQLAELEAFAYETGEAGLPQSVVLEKQKVIIDQLRNRLDLNVEDLDTLSADELRRQVDHAVCQLISPLKMKEQLLDQLTTQIQDLERFVEFLQGDGPGCSFGGSKHCTCNCPVHGHNQGSLAPYIGGSSGKNGRGQLDNDQIKEQSLKMMQRLLHFLHVFAAGQFGCAPDPFKKNILKETVAGYHWGDQRAAFQMALDKLISSAERAKQRASDSSEYTSDGEEAPSLLCDEQLAKAARKSFAPALRDLIHHGLMKSNNTSMALVPWTSCFSRQARKAQPKLLHAWDLILAYYNLKRGPSYNATPQRRLSESFGLDIVGGKAVTTKQMLLSAIGCIISSHTPLKRSHDAHFKAFVCEALNRKKLVSWLKLIFRTHSLIDEYYQPWSYAARTGFEDSLKAMEKLQAYNFNLPVDLAIQQLQSIKDAF